MKQTGVTEEEGFCMRIKEGVKEYWKQPVKPSDAWKIILFAIFLVGVAIAFGPVISHSYFDRLGWVASLLYLWALWAHAVLKHGWRVLQNFQGTLSVGYTFFAGGNILPHGTAASWITGVGAFLLIVAWIFTHVDFSKTKQPVSADTVPPA